MKYCHVKRINFFWWFHRFLSFDSTAKFCYLKANSWIFMKKWGKTAHRFRKMFASKHGWWWIPIHIKIQRSIKHLSLTIFSLLHNRCIYMTYLKNLMDPKDNFTYVIYKLNYSKKLKLCTDKCSNLGQPISVIYCKTVYLSL